MKSFFALLAIVIGFLSVVAGLVTGFGVFAYGIYLIVLLCKGTVAVTFWAVCKAVICCLGAALSGWLVFFIGAAIAGICGALSK